jgi:hypothetical protein
MKKITLTILTLISIIQMLFASVNPVNDNLSHNEKFVNLQNRLYPYKNVLREYDQVNYFVMIKDKVLNNKQLYKGDIYDFERITKKLIEEEKKINTQ